MTSLIRYEAAKAALAEARAVDEILQVRNQAEQLKLYARQAKDLSLLADATEIRLRAERKLGVLLVNAKETGQLGIGRPSRSNLSPATEPDSEDGGEEKGSAPEQFSRVTLEEAGIDRKLSSRAQKWARLGDEDFDATLLDTRERILSGGAHLVDVTKDARAADKKARRAAREQELAAKQVALPDAKFGVILADPEWRFETYSETGMDRSADNHYPTSDIETIKSRDVGSLAADDCVLFLWATVPMLPQALDVVAAWGFAYRSHVIWRKAELLPDSARSGKLILGTGFWFRNGHELLLVATRGKVPAPAMGEQWPSVVDAAPLKHSEKPAKFYELIEEYFPNLPKIELNARAAREGWARWGYEAPEENSAGAEPPTLPADDGEGNPALPEPNTPEGSGTAREASGGQPLPGDGDIGGLQQGIQSAPHPTFKHTKATAEPILREKYGKVSQVALAAELNVPLGTVQTWAYRLGLTKHERLSELAHALNNRARAKKGESQ